jgi:16S rRNA (guanine527-N7)-methyltransferase
VTDDLARTGSSERPRFRRTPEPELAELGHAIELVTGQRSETEVARFREYLALLERWNRIHRLTGYRSAREIVRQLFLDAFLFLARIPRGPLSMADLGTGPGIPGIPIGILRPDIALTLVESRRKHVSFLATLKRELNLPGLTVLEGRAEHLVTERPSLAESFDVVVTRAVGAKLISTAARYLKPGGLFLAGAPPVPPGEIGTMSSGGLCVRWERVAISGLSLDRALLIAQKIVQKPA